MAAIVQQSIAAIGFEKTVQKLADTAHKEVQLGLQHQTRSLDLSKKKLKVRYKSPEDYRTLTVIDISSSQTRSAPTEPTDSIFGATKQAFVLVQLNLLRRIRSDQAFPLDQPIKVGGDVACSHSVPIHEQLTALVLANA